MGARAAKHNLMEVRGPSLRHLIRLFIPPDLVMVSYDWSEYLYSMVELGVFVLFVIVYQVI